MSKIQICISKCSVRICEKSTNRTVDICPYGIFFYNDNGTILKKEPHVSLQNLCNNLRHVINPILSTIVENVIEINDKSSIKRIDINDPTSRILGLTVMLDHFIEMIAGANYFQPIDTSIFKTKRSEKIVDLLVKYFNIYSILKSEERADNLELNLQLDQGITISYSTDIIEYLISILMDNVWKHSLSGSIVSISHTSKEDNFIDLIFKNTSKPIPHSIDIFEQGMKHGSKKGFGYGLYWAKVLIEFYNNRNKTYEIPDEYKLELEHSQKEFNDTQACQIFRLKNINVK